MSTSIFGAVAGDRIQILFLVVTLRNVNKHFLMPLPGRGNKGYRENDQMHTY
jgi:hypothetical protein